MANVNVLDIMKTRLITPLEFEFDRLQIPPMEYFLSYQDVQALHSIATSVKLSSNIKMKYKMIDDIMRPRGFKRFAAGTNRVVYSYLEDTSFVVKIAVDRVGMQDNPAEFRNQQYLKPYVTKMFYISPCGTVGFSERVLPIKNKEEFKEIASDVFDLLVMKILGEYVVEDIGTKYFMNYGVRPGYGPVLLDYPYVYPLDGKKLFCTNILPDSGCICDGEIDYDEAFNNLVCTKCGKKYLACELRDENANNRSINIKGGNTMKVSIMYGDKVISESLSADEVMKRRTKPESKHQSSLKVNMCYGDNIITDSFESSNDIREEKKNIDDIFGIKKMNVSIKDGDEVVNELEDLEEKQTPIEKIKENIVEETTKEEEVVIENNIEDEEDEEDEYEVVDQSVDLMGDLYSSRSSDEDEEEEDDEDDEETSMSSKYDKYYEDKYDNVRTRKIVTKGFKNKNSKFISHDDD